MDKSITVKIIREDGGIFEVNNSEWFAQVNDFDGFGNWENDITTVDNAIGHGGIIASARIAQKDRTIRAVYLDKTQKESARHQAASFFNSVKKYKVYVSYMGRVLWFEGRVHKMQLLTKIDFAPLDLRVTFLCANPFLKSQDNFGKNIAELSGVSGFPYLCSITEGTLQGTTGGRFNFAQVMIIENDGDVDTECKAVLTADGEVLNPVLFINGAYVRVMDLMQYGDEIVMDFTANPPTVKKNGENFIGHCDRTSAFDEMVLKVGDSEVSFDADNGSNLLNVTLYYNKLYGAI